MEVASDGKRIRRIIAQQAFPGLKAVNFARLGCNETPFLRQDRAINRFYLTVVFYVAQVESGAQSLKNRLKRDGLQPGLAALPLLQHGSMRRAQRALADLASAGRRDRPFEGPSYQSPARRVQFVRQATRSSNSFRRRQRRCLLD